MTLIIEDGLKRTARRIAISINWVLIISAFATGFGLSSLIWMSGGDKHYMHKLQFDHLSQECITSKTRDIHEFDGHYRCFDGNTIVELNYDYLYSEL